MTNYEFTKDAEKDLREVARYTLSKWHCCPTKLKSKFLLDSGSELRPTSHIHVVIPQEEGIEFYLFQFQ